MKRFNDMHDAIEGVVGERIFKLIRYLISGGTAALVNWVSLFLLVHIGMMYYLYASILAFVISIGASFAMQKFWTFRDNAVHDIQAQLGRYLVVILFSLVLNTALMYMLVEMLTVWYLTAQVIATVIIAVTNFFCYKHFVFRERTTAPSIS
jgi:dolichol-phosphate mannosyltransferase